MSQALGLQLYGFLYYVAPITPYIVDIPDHKGHIWYRCINMSEMKLYVRYTDYGWGIADLLDFQIVAVKAIKNIMGEL